MWMPWRRRQSQDDPRPTTGALARDERLSAHLDGELPAGEVEALDRELALDPDMRSALEGLRQVRDGLQALHEVRAPRSFAMVASQARRGRAAPWMERLPWVGRRARTDRAPGTTGMPWMELATRVGAATAAVALLLVVAGDELIGDSGNATRSTSQFAQGEIESAVPAANGAAFAEELAVAAGTTTQAAEAETAIDEPPEAAPALAADSATDSATDPGTATQAAEAGTAISEPPEAAPAPAAGSAADSATDPGTGEAVEADSAPADSAGTEAGLATAGETFAAPAQPESEDAGGAEGPAGDARSAAPDAGVETTEAGGAPSLPDGDEADDGEAALERALESPPGTTPADDATAAPEAPPVEQSVAAEAAGGTIEEQAGDSGIGTARIVELVLAAATAVLGAAAAGQWWLSRRRW